MSILGIILMIVGFAVVISYMIVLGKAEKFYKNLNPLVVRHGFLCFVYLVGFKDCKGHIPMRSFRPDIKITDLYGRLLPLFSEAYLHGRIRAQQGLAYPTPMEFEQELAIYVTEEEVQGIASELIKKWRAQSARHIGNFLASEFARFQQ